MAGPTMNTGHQIPYLQVFLMPYLLKCLFQAAYLTNPRLWKRTYDIFVQGSSWHLPLQGRQTHSIPKRLREKKKPSVQFWVDVNKGISRLRTYLVPIAFLSTKLVVVLRVRWGWFLHLVNWGSSHPFPDQPSPLYQAWLTAPQPFTSTPTPTWLGLIPSTPLTVIGVTTVILHPWVLDKI